MTIDAIPNRSNPAQGASASQVVARGYGESQAVADNSTADGRAQNRRVVMKELLIVYEVGGDLQAIAFADVMLNSRGAFSEPRPYPTGGSH